MQQAKHPTKLIEIRILPPAIFSLYYITGECATIKCVQLIGL